MPNIPVILIGPENKSQREDALYPFWDLKNMWQHSDDDPRLKFLPDFPKEDMEKEFKYNLEYWAKEGKEPACKTVDEYAYMFYEYEFSKEYNAYGRFCNPNGKFVDYEIGGHFDSLIPIKDSAQDQYNMSFVNYAKIKDIDFEKAKELAMDELEEIWEYAWEVFPDQDSDEQSESRKVIFGIEDGDTFEEWSQSFKYECSFCPVAFIHNKEWIEKDIKGFFGVDSYRVPSKEWSKEFYDFIQSLDPETMITVIDCSISA